MTATQKALLTKELSKISAGLERAKAIAANAHQHDLALRLNKRQRAIANEIIAINGGPVKLTGADLLRS